MSSPEVCLLIEKYGETRVFYVRTANAIWDAIQKSIVFYSSAINWDMRLRIQLDMDCLSSEAMLVLLELMKFWDEGTGRPVCVL